MQTPRCNDMKITPKLFNTNGFGGLLSIRGSQRSLSHSALHGRASQLALDDGGFAGGNGFWRRDLVARGVSQRCGRIGCQDFGRHFLFGHLIITRVEIFLSFGQSFLQEGGMSRGSRIESRFQLFFFNFLYFFR